MNTHTRHTCKTVLNVRAYICRPTLNSTMTIPNRLSRSEHRSTRPECSVDSTNSIRTITGGNSMDWSPSTGTPSCYNALTQPWPPTMILLLLSLLLMPWRTMTSYAEQVGTCSETRSDGKVCNFPAGDVCRNGSCVSACSERHLHRCRCAHEDDNYCYLCCGNAHTECQPAHKLGVLRPNGEYWERDSCRRCRSLPNGLQCDDTQPDRLCHEHKCSDRICYGKATGEYCDMSEQNVCIDHKCSNPCAAHNPRLLVCECAENDARTGMASDDRCQLCCFDFTVKRCQNAYVHYGIKTKDGRPLPRVGLPCRSGTKQCNNYGLCAASAVYSPMPVAAVVLSGLLINMHL